MKWKTVRHTRETWKGRREEKHWSRHSCLISLCSILSFKSIWSLILSACRRALLSGCLHNRSCHFVSVFELLVLLLSSFYGCITLFLENNRPCSLSFRHTSLFLCLIITFFSRWRQLFLTFAVWHVWEERFLYFRSFFRLFLHTFLIQILAYSLYRMSISVVQ